MGILREDFRDRVSEINEYFEFIEKVELGYNRLSKLDDNVSINGKLEKIFKSTAFLLLYNLIESTVLNSIVDIFDELRLKNISYSQANDHIKKYWLKYKLNFDNDIKKTTLAQNVHKIIDDIFVADPINIIKDHIEYGGSLETTKIKAITTEIGIRHIKFKCRKNDYYYKSLLEIKEKRNDLAHGKFSFATMSEHLTYRGIERNSPGGKRKIDSFGLTHLKEFTISLLEKYITDIESYIDNEDYKSR